MHHSFGFHKSPKSQKRMEKNVRSLKERKRTERSEQKRMWCPTLNEAYLKKKSFVLVFILQLIMWICVVFSDYILLLHVLQLLWNNSGTFIFVWGSCQGKRGLFSQLFWAPYLYSVKGNLYDGNRTRGFYSPGWPSGNQLIQQRSASVCVP